MLASLQSRRNWLALPATPLTLLVLSMGILSLGCQGETGPPSPSGETASLPSSGYARDIHSAAQPEKVRATHADLDWTIDFEKKQIRGTVTWTLERSPDAVQEPLVLDTRGLTIEEVTSVDGNPVDYELAEETKALGAPLIIHLAPDENQVHIRYHTGPDSSGLQWLAPAQTAGKKQPFLFSQAQSILARTMLPCQDSPGVRITYTAQVQTPPDLTAVMAAKRLGGGQGEPFRFEMPQPIPSYLIAIAVGDIAFRELGPRSGVFAEPSVVDKAAYEFADIEALMDSTEKLYGPYRWERYDLIVLPPSFPFGGMENPRLTFATPTILAGDRSLISLVSHELAHSWSGNLVTNATWSDFWLNEGMTVYLDRRILEEVYGTKLAGMEAVLGKQDLLTEMKDLEPGFTALHNVSLAGRDPDDAFSQVPYEKGYLFLRLLEEEFGREKFDSFLRSWFDENAFQSRTTGDFETKLRTDLFQEAPERWQALKVDEWLYEEGLPDNAPEPQSDVFAKTEIEANAFARGEKKAGDLPANGWSTQEWLHFLRALPEDLDAAKMAELDEAWSVTSTGNSEILMQWLLQSIRSGYEKAYPALEKFLTDQGRRKFLKPLYTELAKSEEGKKRGVEIYRKARPLYHPISTNTIDQILEYSGG